MIKKVLQFVVVLTLVPQIAFSKKTSTRKPSQVKQQRILVKSVYGEKISLFSIVPSNGETLVEFSNNSGAKGSRIISAKDFDFLKNKISKMSGGNDKAFCLRNYTTISTGERELTGCMGAPNKLAKDIQATVNLLSVLF